VKLNCARLLAHASILRAGNETFEKLGTLGTSANLLVYLTQVFHMRSVDAATLLNGLNGTTSLAPIIGAFLSDAYLGRYLALAIASVASLIVSTTAISSTGPSLLYIYIFFFYLIITSFATSVVLAAGPSQAGRPAASRISGEGWAGGWNSAGARVVDGFIRFSFCDDTVGVGGGCLSSQLATSWTRSRAVLPLFLPPSLSIRWIWTR
jgi:hypothetical protein